MQPCQSGARSSKPPVASASQARRYSTSGELSDPPRNASPRTRAILLIALPASGEPRDAAEESYGEIVSAEPDTAPPIHRAPLEVFRNARAGAIVGSAPDQKRADKGDGADR